MHDTINIGADVDAVVANFQKKFSVISNSLFGDRCYLLTSGEQVKTWNFEEWYPITKDELHQVWNNLSGTENVWETLEVVDPDGWEFFKNSFMKNARVNVYFITDRAKSEGKTIARQTMSWLKSHGWEDPQVIVSSKKSKVIDDLQLQYFIDDKPETIADVRDNCKGCKMFAFDYPYNRHVNTVSRVKGLKDYSISIQNDLAQSVS